MAKITFCLPSISRKSFSGGVLTVCEYANGMARRGHHVSVVTLDPSERPEWVDVNFELVSPQDVSVSKSRIIAAVLRRDRQALHTLLQAWTLRERKPPYMLQRAHQIERTNGLFPQSDVTVATSYETALAVWRYGSGRKYYFMQHFEPLFSKEKPDPLLAELDARSTYFLPELNLIANSSWLSNKIEGFTGQRVPVCLNAIDHTKFFPNETRVGQSSEPFTVISYGGRDAEWKGIHDAATAIKIARETIRDLRWRVFGSSLLPPDNPIAQYEALGFLAGEALRQAYCHADVLLAPSWYESFPLFPLEAMACQIGVVTTPYGVEDYTKDGQNSLVVPPKDPQAMAAAIIRLANDRKLCRRLAAQGAADARELTWAKSVARMAEIIGA
jgi:glycosyltransferase involved in cell wall biosynthesis